MEPKSMPKEREGLVVPKKDYTAPELIVYGKLIELTAGGTGINDEHSNPGSPSYTRSES